MAAKPTLAAAKAATAAPAAPAACTSSAVIDFSVGDVDETLTQLRPAAAAPPITPAAPQPTVSAATTAAPAGDDASLKQV